MATNIRRSLYIGLGGTGMRTLLKVKKQFIDTYGELPPMIGFLGLDTDGGAYNDEIDSRYGKVKLDPNEQMPLTISNPRAIFENQKEHMSWIEDKNAAALDGLQNIGAGQIRSNGRFVLKYRYKEVAKKIKNIVDQISSADIRQNDKYKVLTTESLDIHMVFSVCGGTGCGTFIDMAYLVKDVVKKCKLSGYAVLPDVFESMAAACMAKVKPNAFGAIQDLDYLMHLDVKKDPIELDWLTTTTKTNERPFNAFFFIDNKNTANDVYDNVLQLEDLVALALVTSAGELSVAAASVSDNVEKNIMEGDMDIKGKKAWVSTMGVCEILFRSMDLSNTYALKAAKVIIERLKTSCADIDTMVNSWIDSPSINIRENNGKDNVIDFILPKNPTYPFSGISPKEKDVNVVVKGYLGTAIDGNNGNVNKTIDNNIAALKEKAYKGLDDQINRIINQECGVENAKNFLSVLDVQIDIFKEEMENERKDLNEDKKTKITNALNTAISDLQEYNSRFMKFKGRLEEYCEEVNNNTAALAVCEREIKRRDAAITFFTGLKNKIAETSLTVNNIGKALDTVYQNCTRAIAAIQNNVNNALQTFQIDLTENKMQSVVITPDAVNIEDFFKYLKKQGIDVLSFEKLNTKGLEDVLLGFTNELPETKRWSRFSIEDVMNEFSDEDFTKLMSASINKSLPMLKFDNKGYIPGELPGDFYYIGVYDKAKTRLAKNDNFKNLVPGTANVLFSSIGQKERVIIYHQVGVVPAFEIAPLFSYQEKYNACNTFCHFDAEIHRRMLREEYSLLPPDAKDDTLELWIKGLIIGKIKNEGGKYYIYNEALGDPLEDFWYELGQYRDEAYSKFRTNRNTLGVELAKDIDDYETTHGSQEVAELLNDVKAQGNYFEKYSQLKMSKDELKKKGYEGIMSQMRDEINFVTKSL